MKIEALTAALLTLSIAAASPMPQPKKGSGSGGGGGGTQQHTTAHPGQQHTTPAPVQQQTTPKPETTPQPQTTPKPVTTSSPKPTTTSTPTTSSKPSSTPTTSSSMTSSSSSSTLSSSSASSSSSSTITSGTITDHSSSTSGTITSAASATTSAGTDTTSASSHTLTSTQTTTTSASVITSDPYSTPYHGAFPTYPVDNLSPPTAEEITDQYPSLLQLSQWLAPEIQDGIWNLANSGSMEGSTVDVSPTEGSNSTDGTDNGEDDADGAHDPDADDDGDDDGDDGGDSGNSTSTADNSTSTTTASVSLSTSTGSPDLSSNGTDFKVRSLFASSIQPRAKGKGKGGNSKPQYHCPTSWQDAKDQMDQKRLPKANQALFYSNVGSESAPQAFAGRNGMLVVGGAVSDDYAKILSDSKNCPQGWNFASVAWAKLASGDVYVMMPAVDRNNPRSWFNFPVSHSGHTSVWTSDEWPVLVKNQNACRIWRFDRNSGLKEAVLLAIRNTPSCQAQNKKSNAQPTATAPGTTLAKRVAQTPAPVAA